MAKPAAKKKPAPKAAKKLPPKPKPKLKTVKPDPFEDEAPKKPVAAKAEPGHNGVPRAVLRSAVDRVVNLTIEQKGIGEDIKEVYSEAKAKGLEPKIIRKIVQIQMADREKLAAEKELLDLYLFTLDPELADVLS